MSSEVNGVPCHTTMFFRASGTRNWMGQEAIVMPKVDIQSEQSKICLGQTYFSPFGFQNVTILMLEEKKGKNPTTIVVCIAPY